MANIKKVTLANGETRYRLRYYVGRDGAKQVVKTETFRKMRDADNRGRKVEGMKEEGGFVVSSKETFTKYLKRWIVEVKEGEVRGRTLYDYQNIVRRYIEDPPRGTPLIGKIELKKLRKAHFRSLYKHMRRERHLAPRTIQYLHAVLRQALSEAVNDGVLAKNPTDGARLKKEKLEENAAATRPTEKARKLKTMDGPGAGRFLEAARMDRYYALWCILLSGGRRPGEALGLKWEDVDLASGDLHVQRSLTRLGIKAPWKLTEPKTTQARRTVPLPATATQALREWRRTQAAERLQLGDEYENNDFVFANEFGKPLHATNLARRNYRRILEAAELGTWEGEGKNKTFRPGFRMYDLRHTCATLLLKAGENPKVVGERLGHASIVLTLDTYSHVIPSMQKEAANKMEAVLFGVSA